MDTILNLGLNEDVVEVIAKKSGNPRWAWDCYRRFIQMFSDVVMEVGKKYFEKLIDQMKERKGVVYDVDLTADDLKELANEFTRLSTKNNLEKTSQAIQKSNYLRLSKLYSVLGITLELTYIVWTTIFHIAGVLLSMFK